jgi:hypothetical protein
MPEHGPRPTLGELQRATPWVWLWCEGCQHHAPLACAVAVILWGPDASSDKLRNGARCTSCGSKGATLQHPGWAGNHIGFQPFPTNVADEMREERVSGSTAARCAFCVLLATAADFLHWRAITSGHFSIIGSTLPMRLDGESQFGVLAKPKGLPSASAPETEKRIGRQGDHCWWS